MHFHFSVITIVLEIFLLPSSSSVAGTGGHKSAWSGWDGGTAGTEPSQVRGPAHNGHAVPRIMPKKDGAVKF